VGRVGAALLLAAGLGAFAVPAAASKITDRGDVHGPLDVREASVTQSVHAIKLKVKVVGPIRPHRLDSKPSLHDRTPHYLCLVARRSGRRRSRRLCIGRRGGNHPWKLGIESLGAQGRILHRHAIKPKGVKASRDELTVRMSPHRTGFATGRYRLHLTSDWNGPACRVKTCRDRAPDQHTVGFRVRPLELAGCHGRGGLFTNGSRSEKRVALTFDDGPSDFTDGFVSALSRKHAVGTFFEVGQEVAGRGASMRRAVAHGDELGDHSFHHSQLPSESDIRATADRIEAASGFRPCDFRPPYGSYNSREISAARREGMSTVTWDVDPSDYTRPGSDAIYQRVVSHVQPGSIVIMHDGGGDRSETLAALPRIIDTLRRRGYSFVTVAKMIGERPKYTLGG
jgi:peptidoglycan/xylan/chitin deacetylase (PgdA/CDA1 family)